MLQAAKEWGGQQPADADERLSIESRGGPENSEKK